FLDARKAAALRACAFLKTEQVRRVSIACAYFRGPPSDFCRRSLKKASISSRLSSSHSTEAAPTSEAPPSRRGSRAARGSKWERTQSYARVRVTGDLVAPIPKGIV